MIDNNASNNVFGIYIWDGFNDNLLKNNVMIGNEYNFWLDGWEDSDFNNHIDASNLVDGKPIFFITNAKDTVYDSSDNIGTFYCISCANVTVRDMNLNNNGVGITFWNTTKSRIQNVGASKNNIGVHLVSSSNNTINGNNVTNNGYGGINLDSSSNNTINGNNASNNIQNGISLEDSSKNFMINNNVSNNKYYGVYILRSGNNIMINNNVSNNKYGIYGKFSDNSNNTLAGNNVSNNEYGIYVDYYTSNNNFYQNNLYNNPIYNAYDSGINKWDNGAEGNYWNDYIGIDSNSDGIGDIPYPIPGGGSVDRYPLMAPYTGLPPTPMNHAPNQPSELYQNKSDGTTPIATGTATNERTVIFKGRVSDPDGDNVRLQVELRRTDEYGGNFDETQGGLKNSSLVTNGSEVSISVSDLIDGNYHWRARAIDEHENKGGWVEFGGNLVSDTDFIVTTSTPTIMVGQDAPDLAIKNHFIDAYNRNGGEAVLGKPTTVVHDAWGYLVQDFPGVPGIPGGVIMYNSIRNSAYYIHGAIWEKYKNYPDKARLGPVKQDEMDAGQSPQGTTGRYSEFETGRIHWISDANTNHPQKGQSFVTYGDLDVKYTSLGGTNHWLGFPIMDQIERNLREHGKFEGGHIFWDERTSQYKEVKKLIAIIPIEFNDMPHQMPAENLRNNANLVVDYYEQQSYDQADIGYELFVSSP